jgi:DHA1 family multidrug resistance protein-like MFS transporter
MGLFLFASFAESLAWGHFSAFTPLYLAELHVPADQIANWTGILGTLGFLLGLPLLPFWGAWAERFGRKPVIVRSSLVEGVIFAIAALAQNPYQLAAARFLGGFVMGNTGVMMAVQSELTPKDKLGLAIALVGSGSSVAMAVGPLLGGLIAAGPGLRAVFWMDSGATFLAAGLLMAFLREPPRPPNRAPVGQLAWSAMKDVVQSPAVRQLFLVYFLFAMGTTAATPFLPIWIGQAYRLAPWPWPLSVTLGIVFAAAGAAMAVGTPLWGWVGDRRGFRPSLRLTLAGTALGMAGQAVRPALALITAARVGQGLFTGGVSANLMALLSRVVPAERRSSVMNLALLPQQIAWFFGPLVGTVLTNVFTLHGMLWTTAALTLAAAALAWVGLGRVNERRVEAEPA